MYCLTLFNLALLNIFNTAATFSLNINCTETQGESFDRFWTSTGFSPTPINNTSTFLLSKDEEINLALIGAVPNEGITHVRIHWLLDLINIKGQQPWEYDYTDLFEFLSKLEINRLSPGFELMGNPGGCLSNWTQLSSHWPTFINHLLTNLIAEFGYEYVRTWRFESHNEPDLKSYNNWNLTSSEFIAHLESTAQALAVFNLTLWGPAGLFKDPSSHPLCWGLLNYCRANQCPVNVLTFHKKGDGNASQVVQRGRDLVLQIRSTYPKLNFSYVNDEADPLTGWMKPAAWRADVRYAAAIAQNVIGYWHSFKEIKADLAAISNDNGFLGFSPNYWTQRTLLARFQMNNTTPPHVQMFKKPVLVLMELLSLLGDKLISINYAVGHPGLSYIATQQGQRRVILITINNDTLVNNTWEFTASRLLVNLKLPGIPKPGKGRAYLLDNKLTNPSRVWEAAGKPDYPNATLRRKMRKREIPRQQEFLTKPNQTDLILKFKVSVPAVLLINLCYNEDSVRGRPKNFRHIAITTNEALLVWDDSPIKYRCLKSYAIESRPSTHQAFRRISRKEFLSTSYHLSGCNQKIKDFCQKLNITGQYRVTTINMWNNLGPYSSIINVP